MVIYFVFWYYRFVTDTTAVMLVNFSLFLLPKYPPMLFNMENSRPYEPFLPWTVTANISWTVVFLIAGGLALADCVDVSYAFTAPSYGTQQRYNIQLYLFCVY